MRLVRRVSSRSNDALWASLLSQYVTFHTSHYSPPHFSASRSLSAWWCHQDNWTGKKDLWTSKAENNFFVFTHAQERAHVFQFLSPLSSYFFLTYVAWCFHLSQVSGGQAKCINGLIVFLLCHIICAARKSDGESGSLLLLKQLYSQVKALGN